LFKNHETNCSHHVRIVQAKYENGIDKEVWVYKKNIFGGKEKIKALTYYKNGNIETEVDYKCDKVNGWARMWYEDGLLYVEGTYKDSKPHGVRTAYHKNGKIFCRAEYDEGKLLHKENWDEEGNEMYLPLDRD